MCELIRVLTNQNFSLVITLFYSLARPEGSIRLAGSGLVHMGRVEILYNGRWGTICNTFWDVTDGEVACQQLGLENNVVNTFTFEPYVYS